MGILPTEMSKPKAALSDFNWIIYGDPKVGKTTLASGFPDVLFLATEDGQGAKSCYRVPIASWSKFLAACNEIASTEHKFKTIAIDTIDNLWDLCSEHMCRKLEIDHESELEWGKAYKMVKGEFFRALTRLSLLPFGLVLISHATEIEVKTRTKKYTKSVLTFSRPDQSRLTGMADFILFCDFGDDGKRVIHTKPNESYIAGDRTGRLPDPMPMSFKALDQAFIAAINTKETINV